MEMIPFAGKWRRRGYSKLSSTNRRNMKLARFGAKRSWRLRLAPKLRLASPIKLWYKLKNAYMNTMLRLSGSTNVFGAKRIPKARNAPMAYSRTEFENRLIFEIYKSMVASFELGYNKDL